MLKNEIYEILVEVPETRDSDKALYLEYLRRKNPVLPKQTIEQIFTHSVEFGVKDYETVSRARRKIQEEIEELRGTSRVRRMRKVREYEFREEYRRKS